MKKKEARVKKPDELAQESSRYDPEPDHVRTAYALQAALDRRDGGGLPERPPEDLYHRP